MTRNSHYVHCALLGLVIGACDDDPSFDQQNLVADLPGVAAFTDAALVNPWGIAFDESGTLWVANNGTETLTAYDIDGRPVGSHGAIEAGEPVTGIAFNRTGGLVVNGGGDLAPSQFVIASETGTLVGLSDQIRTLTAVAFANARAAFTGVAVSQRTGVPRVFAADFVNRRAIAFDDGFLPVGTLIDPDLPPAFGPFGIQRLGDQIYVAYAVVGEDGDEERGAGLGIVSEFDLDGTFVRRIATGGSLDAPWGIALAPTGFGKFGGDFLIGNFGDGRIVAIDRDSLNEKGVLERSNGDALVIEGLWGMAFSGDSLFVAAGTDDETHGLLARITQN